MKRTIYVTCAAALIGCVAHAQQPSGAAERRTALELAAQAGGGTRVAVETRVTRGKPYAAEAVTEFVQVLGDGNRIVRKTTARLYRDSDGRTRREAITEDGSAPEINSIVITDPVSGSSLILDAGTKTAIKGPGMFARIPSPVTGPGTGSVAIARTGPIEPRVEVVTASRDKQAAEAQTRVMVGGPGAPAVTTFTAADGGMIMSRSGSPGTREDLGEQQVEGVMAKGTRTTTVVPAGAIGNEQPITTISEQWFSEDLELLVLTKHSDPRVGETTYRLTNITRSEPDRSLFQAPADYTVQERLVRPPVMFRQ